VEGHPPYRGDPPDTLKIVNGAHWAVSLGWLWSAFGNRHPRPAARLPRLSERCSAGAAEKSEGAKELLKIRQSSSCCSGLGRSPGGHEVAHQAQLFFKCSRRKWVISLHPRANCPQGSFSVLLGAGWEIRLQQKHGIWGAAIHLDFHLARLGPTGGPAQVSKQSS